MGSERVSRYLYLGAIQGFAAWAAYAVVEFVCSSLLYKAARPYSVFTAGHWQLTGLLVGAYLVAGLVAGAIAGAAVYLLEHRTASIRNNDSARVLEHAATLTLVVSLALNVVSDPLSVTGKYSLFWFAVVLAALLVASIRSGKWSERLGLLTNPWIVSGLFLGLGQEFSLLQMEDVGRTLGVKIWLWGAILAAILIAFAAAAIFLGRRLRDALSGTRFPLSVPGQLAVALGLVLALSSMWFGARTVHAEKPAVVSARQGRPNVVIVVMDTVRADHLSLYGYERDTTPNLKKLSRDAMVYTHAISPTDMTLSSHASLFTGMYASWHGAYCKPPEASYGRELDAKVPTLAEILQKNGYSTVGVSANMYLRADLGLQRGFGTFRIPRPLALLPSESYWYLLRTGMRRALAPLTDTAQFDRLYSRGDDINQEVFSALEHAEQPDAPFFLFVNYMDAHFPYIPPAPFDGLFPGKAPGIMLEDMEETSSRVVNGQSMPPREQAHRVSQYDAGIAYIDSNIGRLADWLKQRNLYDNTLFIVASDHGEAFGEKHLVLHGNSAYQNLLHVALTIKYPKGTPTGIADEPVSLIDVLPTTLGSLGYQPPAGVQGRDLRSPAARPRQIFSESFPCPVVHPPECRDGCMQRAVFSWPNKLITSSAGKSEYYDIGQDPNETRNLYAGRPESARELATDLNRWLKTTPALAAAQANPDSETLHRLKSLGYVQ